jgi:AcrR family transcriptional regulator
MSNDTTTSVFEQRILDAAEALLHAFGDSFTIDQLSSKANVSRATIYRRIGNKEALLQRLTEGRGQAYEPRDARRQILDAVPHVISRHGVIGATMEQIADEASVGVATVYRHFGGKDRLMRTFIEEFSPQLTLQELVLHPSTDIVADLTALAEKALRFFYSHRDMMRIVLFATDDEQAYFSQIRAGSSRLRDLFVAYFAAQLQAGRLQPIVEPQEAAMAFIGMLFGFGVLGPLRYGTRVEDPQQTARVITRLFLGQLTVKEVEDHDT